MQLERGNKRGLVKTPRPSRNSEYEND
jgi:hypothetical protein